MTLLHAHRGASHAAPENTLAAFALAVAEGADAIELDVRLSLDDVPVVFHDDTLTRMTGVAGSVAALPWEQLAALSIAGEPIPRLIDLVDFVRAHPVALNVELKPTPRPQALAAACAPILGELMALVPTLVSSFDPRVLADLHRRLPTLSLALILDDLRALSALRFLPHVDLHARHDLIDAATLPILLATPRTLRAWTVDEPAVARRLLALAHPHAPDEPAVGALITNRPASIRAALRDTPTP